MSIVFSRWMIYVTVAIASKTSAKSNAQESFLKGNEVT